MATLPHDRECPRPEALWSQRLPTGRRAVTRGQQKPLGVGVAQGAGKHRCPYLQAIGSAGSESPLGVSPPPATRLPRGSGQGVPSAQGQDQAQGHEAQERASHPCLCLSLSSGQSREPLSSIRSPTGFFPFNHQTPLRSWLIFTEKQTIL